MKLDYVDKRFSIPMFSGLGPIEFDQSIFSAKLHESILMSN